MFSRLAILALLTVADPSAAPASADILTPPTSALYRSLAPFALREVSILDSENLELRIRLGSYANPLELPNGFSHPVIEVYVGGSEPGLSELLPGSGMRLPEGETWSVAFQLTGDSVFGFAAADGSVTEFEPELVLVDGYLYVYTDLPAIEDPGVAALTGLYSPFHADGWRPLGNAPGPWAFSAAEQALPVVDVLALEEDAQQAALRSGILPVTAFSTVHDPDTIWFVLMAAGVGLAGVGLILRAFSTSSTPAAGELPGEEDAVQADTAEGVEDSGETATLPPVVPAPDAGAEAADVPAAAGPVDEPAEEEAAPDPEAAEDGISIMSGSDTADADADWPEEPEEPEEAGDAEGAALPEFASIDFGEFSDWLGDLGSDTDDEAYDDADEDVIADANDSDGVDDADDAATPDTLTEETEEEPEEEEKEEGGRGT